MIGQVNVSKKIPSLDIQGLQNRIVDQAASSYSKFDPAPTDPRVRNKIYSPNPNISNQIGTGIKQVPGSNTTFPYKSNVQNYTKTPYPKTYPFQNYTPSSPISPKPVTPSIPSIPSPPTRPSLPNIRPPGGAGGVLGGAAGAVLWDLIFPPPVGAPEIPPNLQKPGVPGNSNIPGTFKPKLPGNPGNSSGPGSGTSAPAYTFPPNQTPARQYNLRMLYTKNVMNNDVSHPSQRYKLREQEYVSGSREFYGYPKSITYEKVPDGETLVQFNGPLYPIPDFLHVFWLKYQDAFGTEKNVILATIEEDFTGYPDNFRVDDLAQPANPPITIDPAGPTNLPAPSPTQTGDPKYQPPQILVPPNPTPTPTAPPVQPLPSGLQPVSNPTRTPTATPTSSPPAISPNNPALPGVPRNPTLTPGLPGLTNLAPPIGGGSATAKPPTNFLEGGGQTGTGQQKQPGINDKTVMNPTKGGMLTSLKKDEIDQKFNSQPPVDTSAPEVCRNPCIADLQLNQRSQQEDQNKTVTVQVNKFLFWDRLLGRPRYIPESVVVPKGFEQLALMMGNRTADLRARHGLAEFRAKFAQLLQLVNIATTLHNAAMLSTSLAGSPKQVRIE